MHDASNTGIFLFSFSFFDIRGRRSAADDLIEKGRFFGGSFVSFLRPERLEQELSEVLTLRFLINKLFQIPVLV
jgi:hypothetical protein